MAFSAAATQELVDLFADLDEVQANPLDPLMEKFRLTAPAFFNAYQSARVVLDVAATHASKEEPVPAVKPGTPGTPADGATKAA